MSANIGSSAKRDFGSFHSSNVQELINIPEEEYRPPSIPITLPTFDGHVEFGCEMKRKHFMLDNSWTFLNHGAFGAAVKQAMEAKMAWLTHIESQPLRFFDREMLPLQVYVIREFARFLGCQHTGLVLLPNVTQGTNTVVQCVARRLSATSQDGQGNSPRRITTLSINYGSTKKLLTRISDEYKIIIDEINIDFPINNKQEIIDKVEKSIHPDTSLAIFDHVSSNYGIILPVQELVQLCHKRGVQVLIDGAHAPGALPLNISETCADYYVGNTHKWLCCPKGCGFLYIAEHLRNDIRPLIVSHGSKSGLHGEFSWIGLMDYTSYLSLLTVLDFWNHIGPSTIRAHIHSQAQKAALLLTNAWNTQLLADSSMFGSMVVVGLPSGVLGLGGRELVYSDAEVVQNTLYHTYKIEVPVKAINGGLYVRISYHVYNVLEDYQKLADAVNELCR